MVSASVASLGLSTTWSVNLITTLPTESNIILGIDYGRDKLGITIQFVAE